MGFYIFIFQIINSLFSMESNPYAELDRSSRRLRFPEFLDNWQMDVVRSSALRTGHFYPQETSLVFISVKAAQTPSQLPHGETNSRPSGLYRRASTNCPTRVLTFSRCRFQIWRKPGYLSDSSPSMRIRSSNHSVLAKPCCPIFLRGKLVDVKVEDYRCPPPSK